MRPVKNISVRYLDVGDIWQGQRIAELAPCTDAYYCKSHYRNFGASCGGYRRKLEGTMRADTCLFFLVNEHYLSSERDGRPIE